MRKPHKKTAKIATIPETHTRTYTCLCICARNQPNMCLYSTACMGWINSILRRDGLSITQFVIMLTEQQDIGCVSL